MKRKDFIKRAGTLGVGAGALALIRPTNVEGGVNDNADLRKTVGYADFSNLAPTLTEAVGNSTLETTAKTLDVYKRQLRDCKFRQLTHGNRRQ